MPPGQPGRLERRARLTRPARWSARRSGVHAQGHRHRGHLGSPRLPEWQATDRLSFELRTRRRTSRLNSEQLTDPAVGDYDQEPRAGRVRGRRQRRASAAELAGHELRLGYSVADLREQLVEMKRFGDQDIAFLAAAIGVPRCRGDCTTLARAKCLRRKCACSRAATSRCNGSSAPTISTSRPSSRSSFRTIPARPAWARSCAARTSSWTRRSPSSTRTSRNNICAGQLRPPPSDGRSGSAAATWNDKSPTSTSRRTASDPRLQPGPTIRTAAERARTEFNPSAYVRFEPSGTATLYAQAAEGFRSGVVNPLIADACLDQASSGRERIHRSGLAVELRARRETQVADGRVAINGAVTARNGRACSSASWRSKVGLSQILNAGDATSDGVESSWWRSRSMRGASTCRPPSTTPSSTTSYPNGSAPGERLPEVPKVNGSAGVQYSFNMGSTWSGFLRADYVHVGEVSVKFPAPRPGPFNATSLAGRLRHGKPRLSFQRGPLGLDLFGNDLPTSGAW